MSADAFYGMLAMIAFSVLAIIFALADAVAGSWWSWLLASVGVFGLFLAGAKNKIGWLIGFFIQPIWIIYAFVTEQYGFIFSAVAYGWVYARNYILWRKEQRKEDRK